MSNQPLRDQIRRLEELLSTHPDDVALRQELLRCHARYLEGIDAGDPHVRRAFTFNLEVLYALSPRDPWVGEVLAGRVDSRYEPAPPADADAREAFEAGREAVLEGDLETADARLREALLAAPDAAAVHGSIARTHLLRQRWPEAWVHASFAVKAEPGSALLWLLAGEALLGGVRPREAFDHFMRALALNPLCHRAEERLAELGPRLGYRWLDLPLRPVVWPLIEARGQHRLAVDGQQPWAVRRAWHAWAEAVVEVCDGLDPAEAPLAGLPRDLTALQAVHETLVAAWRRTRRLRRRSRSGGALMLDWLGGVHDDGLLPAYLFYSYLHPDLAPAFARWRDEQAGAMERFLRAHVVRRDTMPWPDRWDR